MARDILYRTQRCGRCGFLCKIYELLLHFGSGRQIQIPWVMRCHGGDFVEKMEVWHVPKQKTFSVTSAESFKNKYNLQQAGPEILREHQRICKFV